jgi:hypothetical protein
MVAQRAFPGDADIADGGGCRTVLSTTEDFVHENPWRAIAFAVLGGVSVDVTSRQLLASRRSAGRLQIVRALDYATLHLSHCE